MKVKTLLEFIEMLTDDVKEFDVHVGKSTFGVAHENTVNYISFHDKESGSEELIVFGEDLPAALFEWNEDKRRYYGMIQESEDEEES